MAILNVAIPLFCLYIKRPLLAQTTPIYAKPRPLPLLQLYQPETPAHPPTLFRIAFILAYNYPPACNIKYFDEFKKQDIVRFASKPQKIRKLATLSCSFMREQTDFNGVSKLERKISLDEAF